MPQPVATHKLRLHDLVASERLLPVLLASHCALRLWPNLSQPYIPPARPHSIIVFRHTSHLTHTPCIVSPASYARLYHYLYISNTLPLRLLHLIPCSHLFLMYQAYAGHPTAIYTFVIMHRKRTQTYHSAVRVHILLLRVCDRESMGHRTSDTSEHGSTTGGLRARRVYACKGRRGVCCAEERVCEPAVRLVRPGVVVPLVMDGRGRVVRLWVREGY